MKHIPDFEEIRGQAVWIYGAGELGRDVYFALKRKKIDINGFIDRSPSLQRDGLLGLPVKNPDQFQDNTAVCFVGFLNPGGSFKEIQKKYSDKFARLYFPQQYISFLPEIARFWLSNIPENEVKKNHGLELRSKFDDEESQRVLDLVVQARLGQCFDLDDIVTPDDQYCPDFLRLDYPISFLDVGAFTGDTLEVLVQNGIQVARWVAFEPDFKNYEKLTETSLKFPKIESILIPCGLSDSLNEVDFSSSGSASKIVNSHTGSTCRIIPYDTMFRNLRINFVKMDIEGFELQALNGMANMLRECRPTIALSAYHKWDDIPVLITALSEIMPNGRFYLRQHAYSCLDTVLYYVPSK